MLQLRTKATLLAGLTLAWAGCSGDDGGFDFATAGVGSAASNDGGSGTAGTGGSDTTGTGGSDDPGGDTVGPSDTGSGPGTVGDETAGTTADVDDGEDDGLPVEPCTAMDILFVVDNSSTMIEEQLRLSSNAAVWLSQVNASTATAANNIHVGVITTDDSAMVTSTAMPCNFASALPYMTMGGATFDQTVFAAEVQCALNVGVGGSSDERPIDRMFEALSNDFNEAGAPNEGFLRQDALLIVVVVTDEEDDFEAKTSWGSAGDPADWIDDLAALKGDINKDVVVLSIIGLDAPNDCPAFQWDGLSGAELSPRLQEFTLGFPAGAVHDACSADYLTFLNGVVPGIAGSCMNFSPP